MSRAGHPKNREAHHSMSNIRLKGSTWHWRLRIPKDLQAAIGQREFSATTGTGDKRAAQIVAARLTAEAKMRFSRLREGGEPTLGEMSRLTKALLAKHLAKQRDRIAEAPQGTLAPARYAKIKRPKGSP